MLSQNTALWLRQKSQNTALWLRQKWIHSGLPKAFVSSAGILNLPITSLPVDNFHDRALWCKSTGINYNMHGWILCRYCATGWFWWISGLRAVTMWSSSSFTKMVYTMQCKMKKRWKYTMLRWKWGKWGKIWWINYITTFWLRPKPGIVPLCIICTYDHIALKFSIDTWNNHQE